MAQALVRFLINRYYIDVNGSEIKICKRDFSPFFPVQERRRIGDGAGRKDCGKLSVHQGVTERDGAYRDGILPARCVAIDLCLHLASSVGRGHQYDHTRSGDATANRIHCFCCRACVRISSARPGFAAG